jgi:hypothetical protein
MMRIVLGLIGCVLSIALIVYRFPIKRFIGDIAFAEKYLGPGGTYGLLVIAGIVGFFFSLMYMTNSFDVIFGGIGINFFESVN